MKLKNAHTHTDFIALLFKRARWKSDGGGEIPKKKIMQGRVTEKENVQRRSEEKKQSCRVNSAVGLTNCTRLKGTLAATLCFILRFSCSW